MTASPTGQRAGDAGQVYRLYGSPDSANLIVRMTLEELGLAYEYVGVDRATAQHQSAGYLALNPQGLIPVLEVPGQDAPMFETGAIILHLADTHGRLAPQSSAPARGRFLKWLFFIANTLHSELRISFKPERYVEAAGSLAELRAGLLDRIVRHFELVDAALATSTGPYFLGDEPSVADLYCAACARWAQIYGSPGRWSPDRVPNLLAMLRSLEQRPAILKACGLEQIEGAPFTAAQTLRVAGVTD